eukprot:GHRR01013706.1.p1 GENE.GHRR01013706.1~~GHRR01013706.1.p1  ORF type:complete len:316 (+),score=43.52 GHRR01013706.1:100-1047(+)
MRSVPASWVITVLWLFIWHSLAPTEVASSAVRTNIEGIPKGLEPRREKAYPSPRCCCGGACAVSHTGKHAFVTSVRTSRYVQPLKQLVCSLAESNPGQLLIVMGCKDDDLSEVDKRAIANLSTKDFKVEYRLVPDIGIQNVFSPRFALNWIKLNSWNMTEFDSVVNLDTDMVVLGDLTHLRTLPTDFAWVPYQGPKRWWHNKGGFVFLRPCQAVFQHMLRLATENEELQFQDLHAEQTFIDWYFYYTGYRLPIPYNTNVHKALTSFKGGKLQTPGGAAPIVLHFANIKPWGIQPEDKLYKWAHRCKEAQAKPADE